MLRSFFLIDLFVPKADEIVHQSDHTASAFHGPASLNTISFAEFLFRHSLCCLAATDVTCRSANSIGRIHDQTNVKPCSYLPEIIV